MARARKPETAMMYDPTPPGSSSCRSRSWWDRAGSWTEGQKRGTKYFAGVKSGGKKAGRRGKAKRKARKAPARKTGKRR